MASFRHFNHVVISGLAVQDAPTPLSADQLNLRLKPVRDRLGLDHDVIGQVAGIASRRLWLDGTLVDEVAAQVGQQALTDAKIDPKSVGLLLNTSVSREWLEPATAAIVGDRLGVGSQAQCLDLSNACLGFLSGMGMGAMMIEQGRAEHVLIVDAESANLIYEKTLARLLEPGVTVTQFRDEMASLTLGSGAVAMVLSHESAAPENAPRYIGAVHRSATQWSGLCRGNLDSMKTDTRTLMVEGMRLAVETHQHAAEALGWAPGTLDHYLIHQVSRPHTEALLRALQIPEEKAPLLFQNYGNLGPAGVPTALAQLRQKQGWVPGQRLGLLGIGSGLQCMMGEIVVPM